MSAKKAVFQVKNLRLTEATEAWIESELRKNPNLKAHEILRNRLHEMALTAITDATVLAGLAAARGIRRDGEGT